MATINLRNVPDELHRRLRLRAFELGLSLKDFVLREAEKGLEGGDRHEERRVLPSNPDPVDTLAGAAHPTKTRKIEVPVNSLSIQKRIKASSEGNAEPVAVSSIPEKPKEPWRAGRLYRMFEEKFKRPPVDEAEFEREKKWV
jgi:plasmid stability protein